MSRLSILPKVSKLSKSVIRLLGCNPSPMTLQGTNTYIIGTGSRRLLIDVGDGESSEYFSNLKRSLNFDKFKISDLLLTHWHQDHVGGVNNLIKDVQNDCVIHKYPGGPNLKFHPSIKVSDLSNGQIFKLGPEEMTLKVLHTPGHSADHVILHLVDENAVFSGDCILGEGTSVFENLKDYMESLKIIMDINPIRIYPGHGPVIDDPVPKIQHYIDHRLQREASIVSTLKEMKSKMTPMEIVKIIYKGDGTPEALYPAACVNVTHHLEKLLAENVVNVQIDGDEKKYFTI